MKINVKGTTVIKSIALAGVLSVGVFLGGHNSEAAGFHKHVNHKENEHRVFSVTDKSAPTHHVVSSTVKAKVEIDVVKVNKKKKHIKVEKPKVKKVKGETPDVKANKSGANKIHSEAAEHASENAKLHAAPNSAVHANIVAGDKSTAKDIKEKPSIDLEHVDKVTDEKQVNTYDKSDAVTEEKDISDDANDENVDGTDKSETVNANKDVKENKSLVNKTNSEAAEHACENAKLHAASNSAVLATEGEKVTDSKTTNEDTENVTDDKNVADKDLSDAINEEKSGVSAEVNNENDNEVTEEENPTVSKEDTSDVKYALIIEALLKKVTNSQTNSDEQAKLHAFLNFVVLVSDGEKAALETTGNTVK